MSFRVKKADKDKQIVWGEVYKPNAIDSHGHMMLAEDLEQLAYSFMKKNLSRTVDTNHDGWPNGSYPIESFVARKGDPDFAEGAWVIAVKVDDTRVWEKIKKGDLGGYSFEGTAIEQEADVSLTVLRHQFGFTEPAEDGHRHPYFISLDERGNIVKGGTLTKSAHKHTITRGTTTDTNEDHRHRIFLQ